MMIYLFTTQIQQSFIVYNMDIYYHDILGKCFAYYKKMTVEIDISTGKLFSTSMVLFELKDKFKKYELTNNENLKYVCDNYLMLNIINKL